MEYIPTVAGTRGRDAAIGGSLVVRDLATLKALADPLRHRILNLLDAPRTVKDIAKATGKPADRLYYHLALLEKHGLVRAVETPGEERRYAVTAESIEVDPAVTMPATVVDHLFTSTLDQVRSAVAFALRRPAADGKKRTMLALRAVRLTEEERIELTARLVRVAEEFVNADRRSSNGTRRSRAGAEDASAEDDTARRVYGVLTGIFPMPGDDGHATGHATGRRTKRAAT